MKIGLWSDCHNFPSLPLMKISAYWKRHGGEVHIYSSLEEYDAVYASKTFSFTADIDEDYSVRADMLCKGGTGYCISVENGREAFHADKNQALPPEIEHICPDYDLYPQYRYAVGFLTRGCPRGCGFCVVGAKEGRCSHRVAELSEFWRGQREIKLLDPNILACKEHEQLLRELAASGARIDFTQGLDIRLTNPDNIRLLNAVKASMLHFAWDDPHEDLTEHFRRFAELSAVRSVRNKSVYVLTNYSSSIGEDLHRIYTLRDLGFSPYVMIYRKETAPREIRRLQRWCNSRQVFRTVNNFKDYKG